MLAKSYLGSIASAAEPEVSPPASEQANCFVESGADTVVVASMAALETAVNAAPPGRNILVAPGTYAGGTRTFNRNGAEANPIIIRPQNGLGTVTITTPNWTLADTSSWLVIEKLFYTSGVINLAGDHNRISRCRFRTITANAIRMDEGGRDCRIDHCDFADANATGIINCLHIRPTNMASGALRRVLIDYCYFHDLTSADADSAILGSFQNIAASDLSRGETATFDHCLFENINVRPEFQVIKWGGMIHRFCTFDGIDGYVQFRAGAHQELRSCWFENIDRVMAWQPDSLVIGNRFIGGVDCWVPVGNGSFEDQQSGAVPTNRYEPSTNSRFIGNRFGSGHLQIGQYWGNPFNPPPSLPVENALLEANTRDSGGNAHEFITTFVNPPDTGTTINATTDEPFVPAVKLTAADVGLNADDPLCP